MRRELSCESVHKLRHSIRKEDERQRLKTQTCDTTVPVIFSAPSSTCLSTFCVINQSQEQANSYEIKEMEGRQLVYDLGAEYVKLHLHEQHNIS